MDSAKDLWQFMSKRNRKQLFLVIQHSGKILSPKIASKLASGLISDVTAIEGEGDDAVFIRPIYSGKAFEKVKNKEGFLFITVRPNNIAPLEKDASRTGDVSSVSVILQILRTVISEVVRKSTEGVDLSEAKVVVAGGRGVKSAEGFEPLQELATLLRGAIGASRGACDADYCDYSLQIGQTGKVVTPDLVYCSRYFWCNSTYGRNVQLENHRGDQ